MSKKNEVISDTKITTSVANLVNFIKDQAQDWGEFKLHMIKIQKLMVDEFGVTARNNDQLAAMEELASTMGSSDSAEND